MAIGNQGGGGGGASAGAIRAGKAVVEIGGDDSKLNKVLSGIKARVLSVGSALRSIGGVSIGAGLVGLTSMFALLKSGVDRADKIGDLSEVFGLTPEAASKMASAFEIAGGSIEDFEMSLSKLAALSKDGEPLDKTLLRVADALGEIDDASERFQAAKEIFGAKFAGKFIDSGGDIKGFLGDAPSLTKEQIANSKKLNQEFAKTSIVLQSALLPVLEFLVPFVKLFAEFVRQNASFLPIAFAVAAGLVAFGTAAAFVGFALPGIVIGFKLIAAAVAFLFTPLGALLALVAVLAVVFRKDLIGAGKDVWVELKRVFGGVFDAFSVTWKGIIDAVRGGDLELAFKIAGKGAEVAWAVSMLAMKKEFNDFIDLAVRKARANPFAFEALRNAGAAMFGPAFLLPEILGVDNRLEILAGAAKLDANDDKVKRLRAELAALAAQAAAGVPVPAARAPGMYGGMKPLADAVKGAFQTFGTAGRQFGYGDTLQKDQLKALLDIKDGKGELPIRVAGQLGNVLLAAFKPK